MCLLKNKLNKFIILSHHTDTRKGVNIAVAWQVVQLRHSTLPQSGSLAHLTSATRQTVSSAASLKKYQAVETKDSMQSCIHIYSGIVSPISRIVSLTPIRVAWILYSDWNFWRLHLEVLEVAMCDRLSKPPLAWLTQDASISKEIVVQGSRGTHRRSQQYQNNCALNIPYREYVATVLSKYENLLARALPGNLIKQRALRLCWQSSRLKSQFPSACLTFECQISKRLYLDCKELPAICGWQSADLSSHNTTWRRPHNWVNITAEITEASQAFGMLHANPTRKEKLSSSSAALVKSWIARAIARYLWQRL